VPRKREEKENDRQRGTNRDKEKKFVVGSLQEMGKKGSSSILI
jgi:hypothetical protein